MEIYCNTFPLGIELCLNSTETGSQNMKNKMESMKYSFSWNDFSLARNERYKHMREDSLLSDVTLVCNDDKQIKAHKVILSSFSSLFKRMFVNNPHPQPIIFLKGVAFSDLDALLDFIYHGEASVAQENFSSFLETAADLEIE